MENSSTAKLTELTDKLEQGIKDLYSSEKYSLYLAAMSKFHRYSFRNTMLIMLQKPDATQVAGFNAWRKDFGRYVKRGEKGIEILAPSPYKTVVDFQKVDPHTMKPLYDNSGKPVMEKKEIIKPAFKTAYVFDVSQTDGRAMPQLTAELQGSIKDYGTFFDGLKHISPYPIVFEDLTGNVKGYCSPKESKIVIKTGLSEMHTVKTAIHEITHAGLHSLKSDVPGEKNSRSQKEVEAESVAYVVCKHYGIDTSDYSFAYVASWSSDKELNTLKGSLDTIQKHSADLIDKMDSYFRTFDKAYTNPERNPVDSTINLEMGR